MRGWCWGLRKKKDCWIITEELGRYGYADVGQIDNFTKKELRMVFTDLLKDLDRKTKYHKEKS